MSWYECARRDDNTWACRISQASPELEESDAKHRNAFIDSTASTEAVALDNALQLLMVPNQVMTAICRLNASGEDLWVWYDQ